MLVEAMSVFLADVQMAVSSAYSWRVVGGRGWGMSAVKMQKRVGERTLPCGTPALGVNGVERLSRKRTWVVRFRKWLVRSLRKCGGVSSSESLCISPWCQTLSKARSMSRKVAIVQCLLL